MFELARTQAVAANNASWLQSSSGGLVIGLARSNEELEAIQRLRYDVFTEDMNAVFPGAVDGLDSDHYDPWCEHLMVKEADTGRIVGTYRLLMPESARKAGGYYSESEFNLAPLGAIYDQIVEVGRSCTHADYRNGSVIMLLWSAVARLVHRLGLRYVLGCASVSLRDDGVTAAQVWRQASQALINSPHLPRLVPLNRYPVEHLNSELPARVPPLIKGYLKIGANICGEPAWDPDFNTADFPVLLDLHHMDARYRRHFGIV
ncbi:GNAT family N-acetyltransferase [Alcaligenaceae bacterium]|nr:GNAT family N-acetyltransferase [Alcaligenaceae bacterium]